MKNDRTIKLCHFILHFFEKKITLEMTARVQCHLVKKPSHIFRQAQYDQRAVSQSLSKTVG